MKVRFNLNTGAKIPPDNQAKSTSGLQATFVSNESGWLDTVEDLGLGAGEWEAYTDDEKYQFTEKWLLDYVHIYFEESE
ncbi:MAG: hypothetical protein GY928_14090 [Colwellia sp.]|nr:hypothetical protein [Colwellia sp.]